MNGNRIFLDTNIILYFLKGDKLLLDLLSEKLIYISFITEIELLSFTLLSKEEEKAIKVFLEFATVIGVNQEIKNSAIGLRKKYKIKLPDSIIGASANYLEIPLFSADKVFKKIEEIEFLYYKN